MTMETMLALTACAVELLTELVIETKRHNAEIERLTAGKIEAPIANYARNGIAKLDKAWPSVIPAGVRVDDFTIPPVPPVRPVQQVPPYYEGLISDYKGAADVPVAEWQADIAKNAGYRMTPDEAYAAYVAALNIKHARKYS